MSVDPRAESVFLAFYENLYRMDEDEQGVLTAAPGVAKEYKLTENGDGTVEYAFTLRSSARWSDGTRVRARDFVYAWRRLVDPATGSPNHALLSMVQGYDAARETGDASQLAVKADGDTVFRVTLRAPCAYFLSEICTAVPTMPLRSDAVSKDPEWSTSGAVLSDGPYQVSVWARDEYIQLARSDSYYEKRRSGPDTLCFRFFSGAAEAWSLYENGSADFILSPPASQRPSGSLPLRATLCVFYNHASESFSDAHVRRAFDLTLDRRAIAAAVGCGALPATGVVPYGVMGLPDEADFRTVGGELCEVDADGYAMRCLDAEGELRNGGYWGAVGFPTVRCLYVSGARERAAAAAAAACWQEKLNVQVITEGLSREEFDRRVLAGDYDLAIDSVASASGDALEYLAPFAGTGEDNALRFVSTPFALLIGVASTSRDPTARLAFLHDAEELLLGDTAVSPLCFGAETYLLREGFAGLRHDRRGCVYFTGLYKIAGGS
ncbi:MAG: peptide ABC transporter substrate-binding protein [Oscillospiraceae bacterium]|nr:peptide ABC transporter substrate-binding protein [Oscillospiraceae bacterium]